MAIGNTTPLTLLPVNGIRIATVNAGIRQTERDDVTVFELGDATQTAAVFTKNKFCAAPVIIAKKNKQHSTVKYLLVNSGNANAGLGDDGLKAAEDCCESLANIVGCVATQILPFSTGVIGEPLPVDVLTNSLPKAVSRLGENNWLNAASAIMTTDTREKGYSRTVLLEGEEITITGIAKGSGMIRPNMATMLAYIATDLAIEPVLLQGLLKKAVDHSFNSITVDGDTSTNDAVVFMATGAAKGSTLNNTEDSRYAEFLSALIEVSQYLAESIVRDGEGANKLITIQIDEASSVDDAREVAYTVAHSPLVKTAFFASDPNWGRILAAIGRADIDQLLVQKIAVYLDDVCIVRNGKRAEEYTEKQGQQVMNQEEITIRVCLQQGECSAHILTCDLSYDYVRINAEYRS